jgi:hypothetical protein
MPENPNSYAGAFFRVREILFISLDKGSSTAAESQTEIADAGQYSSSPKRVSDFNF